MVFTAVTQCQETLLWEEAIFNGGFCLSLEQWGLNSLHLLPLDLDSQVKVKKNFITGV